MIIKPKHYLLFFTFLAMLTNACAPKNHNAQETLATEVKDPIPSMKGEASPNLRLKFTSGIRSILEDSQGNVWFGSDQEGIAVHQGINIMYYDVEQGLSHHQIRSIYEAKNGTIWFENGEGISNYNGYEITTPTERNYNLTSKWTIDDNNLWFKGDKMIGYTDLEGHPGVYQYDGEVFSYLTFPVKPQEGKANYYSVTTPFIKSKNGNLWFGTYGAAIRYNGSDFTIIDNEYLGYSEETGFLHIRSILEDSQGNLWIGNNGIGVLKYDGAKVINFTKQQKLTKEDTPGNTLEKIFSIGEDTLGNIWFGTVGSGVWRYDGGSLKNFTEKDGLPSKHIWIIYRNKEGEMWFGGDKPSGVYVFNGVSFERKY